MPKQFPDPMCSGEYEDYNAGGLAKCKFCGRWDFPRIFKDVRTSICYDCWCQKENIKPEEIPFWEQYARWSKEVKEKEKNKQYTCHGCGTEYISDKIIEKEKDRLCIKCGTFLMTEGNE